MTFGTPDYKLSPVVSQIHNLQYVHNLVQTLFPSQLISIPFSGWHSTMMGVLSNTGLQLMCFSYVSIQHEFLCAWVSIPTDWADKQGCAMS